MHAYNPLPAGLGTSTLRLDRPTAGRTDAPTPVDPPAPRAPAERFGAPWPLRESPHLEEARPHAGAWLEKFGLASAPHGGEVVRDWKLAEAAAWLYPDASARGVALAAALLGWYFAPFDGAAGERGKDLQRAARLAAELGEVVSRPGVATSDPVSAAYAELWRRSGEGMSQAWRDRAAQSWREFFAAQLEEVSLRVNGRIPDAAMHLRLRDTTGWVHVLIDLMEAVGGYELPAIVRHAPVLEGLRQVTAELLSLGNDLVSADREAAAGDAAKNLLLMLEAREGCARPEAIVKLRKLWDERLARFLHLEQRAPDLDGVLDLAGRTALRRYLQGLRDLVAGGSHWHHTSGRYGAAAP